MTTLTKKELAVLKAIIESDYGNSGLQPTWEFDISDRFISLGYDRASFAGVVSSLVKKNLVFTQEYDKGDWIIGLTDAGKATMSVC